MIHAIAPFVLSRAKAIWPVAVVAWLSWISIIVCIDPAGSYPQMPEGPGLTVDEIFNVEQGVYLVEQARALGWLNLVPGTSQEAYRVENGYNPDHPPLGRWWLGVHHHFTRWLAPPFHPEGSIVTACARAGSATAFALTVLLIGSLATAWSGRSTGVLTAVSLVLMPRVYGHAHLASLETITNLTCTASVLVVASWWSGPLPPTKRAATIAGIVLGLALLTKIQAVLIPIPVICWAFWRWRARAAVPLGLWCATAFVVFLASWPYLWFAPVDHLFEYLVRTTNRATLQVWYFGQKYADKDVPWHYPFVMFALTVPAILHGLGLMGMLHVRASRTDSSPNAARDEIQIHPRSNGPQDVRSQKQRVSRKGFYERDILLLMCMLFPLVVFALPGVAVYDGERLFLTSFPLWAFFVGRGWLNLWEMLLRSVRSRWAATAACFVLLLIVASPLVTMAPCHLCYYNGVTPILAGSYGAGAGLEVDYWGEGITRRLLRQLVESVPEGATVAVMPTLHQFQADEYRRQSPILRAHGAKLVEYRQESKSQKYILVYRRRADLPEHWDLVKPDDTLGTTVLGGRQLAYFARRAD